MQHLTAQNSSGSIGHTAEISGAEESADMVNIIITKFSQEIERLKEENALLKQARDNVTAFYKEEFAKLWQKSEK